MDKLTSSAKNTWCPGCGNFPLFEALKKAILDLQKEGQKEENFVLVSGIGCHGKISDYINMNSFYGLHGRAIPVATGLKLGNPNLNVIVSSGDGDSYSEGISHLIHSAKRNSNITVLIHDNHNFALTVKQFTSTSPQGFKGSTTPLGSVETPLNPLELMLVSGATFVARGYSGKMNHLSEIIKKAINHKGFSFVEILQPCVAWFNTYEKYGQRTYEYESKENQTKSDALIAVSEWDYNNGDKIPLGIFYQFQKPSFEESLLANKGKKKINVKNLIEKHV